MLDHKRTMPDTVAVLYLLKSRREERLVKSALKYSKKKTRLNRFKHR